MIETFEIGISSQMTFMKEMFTENDFQHNLRISFYFQSLNVKAEKYGIVNIQCIGQNLWVPLADHINILMHLTNFKQTIKSWKGSS